jgi:predicted transposase YbfD/YdcC
MTENDLDYDSCNALGASIREHFAELEDYRREQSIHYRLVDILFIIICAVISGANTIKAIARYAKLKENWLREVLKLPDKVPAYVTFWTVLVMLSPEGLERCFIRWVESNTKVKEGRFVAIDGKAQRGTAKIGKAHSFVHIVSAWASAHHLTLGQLKVDGKSNEITAIPKLLDMIDVEKSVITIDAMGCQTAIAAKIVDRKGDYVLALKGNQGLLADEVQNYFDQAEAIDFEGVTCHAVGSKTCGHGRIEIREIYAVEDIDWLPQADDWVGLKTIVMIKSSRSVLAQPPVVERRYYISSLSADAVKLGNAVREHWGIEQTHWILDVAFREDDLKANAGSIAENMSLARRIALNLLKQEKTAKCGIELKRQMAGWDNAYLLKVLGVKSFS